MTAAKTLLYAAKKHCQFHDMIYSYQTCNLTFSSDVTHFLNHNGGAEDNIFDEKENSGISEFSPVPTGLIIKQIFH